MPRPRAISTDHHDAEEPPPNALELGSLSEGFFSEADANGDGMVTKAEFIQWHHVKKGRAPTDVDMKKFYDADTNGDGRISVAEFERYISKRRAPKLALQTSMAASGSDEPVPEPELAFGSLSEGESRPATPDDLLDSPSDCIDCTGSCDCVARLDCLGRLHCLHSVAWTHPWLCGLRLLLGGRRQR